MARGSERARRGRARQVVNGSKAVDLSTAGMTDKQAARVQAEMELAFGQRCHGCGRRVGIGLRFCSIDPRDAERPAIYRVACNRDDCDFAELARNGATSMEMVEFAWLDPAGVESSSMGVGMKPHPDADAEPADGQREYTGSRFCSVCKQSKPLPKTEAEEAAWGTTAGGELYACPECKAAGRGDAQPSA